MNGRATRRRILRGALGAILALALTASAVLARPSARQADGPKEWRREVLHLLNDTRARHQLATLRINRRLSENAQAHTRHMIDRRRVFGTEDLADLVERYGATRWAEELGRGRALEAIVRAWLNHDDTRQHLLDERMRHAAIGVLFAGGRFWVTVYLHN